MNISKQLAFLAMLVLGISSCAIEGPVVPGPGPYMYDYYYYPSVGVYFNVYSGYYHYYSNGRWVRSVTLPPTIYLNPRDRHQLKTKEPDPYLNNQIYQGRYKPIPNYKTNRDRDSKEREYNRKSFEKYRKDKRH